MIKDCCKDLTKREERRESEDLMVSVCQACGCRHFELTVDPAVIGIRVSGL